MMDLNRWGITRFTHITERYKDFREFLADVLEGERSLISVEDAPTDKTLVPFSIRNDVRSVLAQSAILNKKGTLRLEALFQAFAPFYEAGFLISRDSSRDSTDAATLRSTFIFGKSYSLPDMNGIKVAIPLPESCGNGVQRCRSNPLLRALKMESIQTLQNATAFILEPVPNQFFIFICDRPGPWQINTIEETYFVINELLEKSKSAQVAKGKSK